MRISGCLIVLLTCITSLRAQQSTEEAFQEILLQHQKLDSYFAVYSGEAPGGKSLKAAITFHRSGKVASVQAQVLIDGQVVAEPFQAVDPELGLVVGGPETMHLKDSPIIMKKLLQVMEQFMDESTKVSKNEPSFEIWRASLFMTANSINARIGIPLSQTIPWFESELPKGTTHIVDDKLTVFTTPEGSTFHVQSATGILQFQNFPNEDGDRTLVLQQLQTNLSEAEALEFSRVSIPPNLREGSLRESTLLFASLQHQLFSPLVELADTQLLSQEMMTQKLAKATPSLQDYLNTAYPADFWKEAIEAASTKGSTHAEQVTHIQKFAAAQWEATGINSTRLNAKTDNGRAVAKLIADGFKAEFLSFASQKIALPK